MLKWIMAAILLLPMAEIAVFIVVASKIGLGWALLLALATTVCGVLSLQRIGRTGLNEFRGALADRDHFDVGAGTFLSVLGALLMVLPGFITDLIGALLLIGPLRRQFVARLRPAGIARPPRPAADVVDLDPEEWKQVPERKLDHRRDGPEAG